VMLLLVLVLLLFPASRSDAGRAFNGTNQSANAGAAVLTAAPFTVCMWARPTNNVAFQMAWSLFVSGSSGGTLRLRGDQSDEIQYVAFDGAPAANAATTTFYTLAVW